MAGDQVLKDLVAACPAARPAAGADAVAGVTPRYAASPASVAEASALLRAAAAHELSVVARGSGSRMDWGAPPRRCDLVVGTSRLDQVVEHAAGDLVARVQAGVSLASLAGVLAGAGQQLALDQAPDGTGQRPAATIGGTLATGMAGPRRLRYGTPRDLVIGITVVRADGTVASSGGKVVKNVAGYDLGKLFAGSYGTLGLIVEAVFRLHPLPTAASYTTVSTGGPGPARAAVAAAAASELAPVAIEVSRAARDQPVQVGVLLEGDPSGLAERSAALRELLGDGAATSEDAPGWWGRMEPPGGPGAPGGPRSPGTLVRVAFWAAALPRVLAAIDAAAAAVSADPQLTGSAASGVIYAALPASTSPGAAAGFVTGLREALARGDADARPASAPFPDSPPVLASAVVVHAPPPVAERVDLWGPVPGLPLMRAVKDQFDPGHRMAPGRFAGGI
ncbi:MAG TPA: FAD-binding oxidoreductase [Streptosporangiaceae bacterium]